MPTKPKRQSDAESVSIRMYRNILGDCFLLTHKRGHRTTRILIDCGVLQGVEGARETMCSIADDIITTCEGVLDIVVLTHEHYDHLSGFNLARDRFFSSNLKIKELWLAWTENPDDQQAVALGRRLSSAHTVIADMKSAQPAIADIYKELDPDIPLHEDARWQTVSNLAKFLGPVSVIDKDENAFATRESDNKKKYIWTNKIVIDELKKKVGGNAVRYLEPGQSVRAGHADGLRAYVLGPPRKEAWLAKDKPSIGKNKEVYLTNSDQTFALKNWVETNLPVDPAQLEDENLSEMPFSRIYSRKLDEVEKNLNDFGIESVEQIYFNSDNSQHAISQDWLDEAESLALKLDSDTNNTSLVLAFELSDGQILLFPGDAQVGNWLSWWGQSYSKEDERGQTVTLTADDILRRTTFYKVGHHASHNATLKELGTKKMTDPRLIAMIPVDADVAKAQGKGWLMPYEPLYDDLCVITGGCVLRGDGDFKKEEHGFRSRIFPSAIPMEYASDQRWVQVTITTSS